MTTDLAEKAETEEPSRPDDEWIDVLEHELEQAKRRQAALAVYKLYDTATVAGTKSNSPTGRPGREKTLHQVVYSSIKKQDQPPSGHLLDEEIRAAAMRRALIEQLLAEAEAEKAAHDEWVKATAPAAEADAPVGEE